MSRSTPIPASTIMMPNIGVYDNCSFSPPSPSPAAPPASEFVSVFAPSAPPSALASAPALSLVAGGYSSAGGSSTTSSSGSSTTSSSVGLGVSVLGHGFNGPPHLYMLLTYVLARSSSSDISSY